MDIFYSIVNFFVQGGAFMYPILLVAAVGAAIAVERYITLTRLGAKNRSAWARVEPALLKGEFDKAREMTSKDDTAISRLLSHRAWRCRAPCGAATTSRRRWRRA